jgi:hypothetical protein
MLFIFNENFRYVELLLRNEVELMSERNLIHIDVRLTARACAPYPWTN